MSITYLEAIREAQAKLLRDDERVFIYGQDVGGTFGGAFKATKGLAKEFPGRVLNTPISEDAMVGHCDWGRDAWDAADCRNAICRFFQHRAQSNFKQRRDALLADEMFQSRSPCVYHRAAQKAAGRFTVSRMESLYAHYPGLIVMTPATVEDAYTHAYRSRGDRRPRRLLRTQISLLPPEGGKPADRRLAHRQSADSA